MTVHWLPPRERWRQLEPVQRSSLPWLIPEVTKPTFVAPGYLALPEGTPVPRGEFTTWAYDLREEPPLPPGFVIEGRVEPGVFGDVGDSRVPKALTTFVVGALFGGVVGWIEWAMARDEHRFGATQREWALWSAAIGGTMGAIVAWTGRGGT